MNKLRSLARRKGTITAEALDDFIATGLEDALETYLPDATDDQLESLLADLARIDLSHVRNHQRALREGQTVIASDLVPMRPATLEGLPRQYRELGEKTLARGEVAEVVFAGGAATRFFRDSGAVSEMRGLMQRYGGPLPKGLFPITPFGHLSFLDIFASHVLAAGIRYGICPILVIMTSSATHPAIERWAKACPLPEGLVIVVRQDEIPRLDARGRLVIRHDGTLYKTGDGHGGIYRALLRQDATGKSVAQRLATAGVRYLVMHNVDNASARALDPVRLGYHVATRASMTITVVERKGVHEKVGLVVRNKKAGTVDVVEYSVCPQELRDAMDDTGRPLFGLAHICTNIVNLDTIRLGLEIEPTLYTNKVVDGIATSTFERLSQHLCRQLPPEQVSVLLAPRDHFFLPTKNLRGEASVQTTRNALLRLWRERLRRAGAQVAQSASVELHPCLDFLDLRASGIGPAWEIAEGATVFVGARPTWHSQKLLDPPVRVGPRGVLWIAADDPFGGVEVDCANRRVTTRSIEVSGPLLGAGLQVPRDSTLRVSLAIGSNDEVLDGRDI